MIRFHLKTAEAVQNDVSDIRSLAVGQAGVSEWDHFVLDALALHDLVNGTKCGHFPFERHATERVQLAREGQRDGMIDDVIATDPAAMQSQQMTMKAANHGDKIAGVLHGIRIGCGFLLNRVSPVGDGGSIRHGLFLG